MIEVSNQRSEVRNNFSIAVCGAASLSHEVGEGEGEGKHMHKNITRRAFCSMLLALPFPAQAQQTKKVPLIGYLSSGNPTSESARSEGIRLALRERGYIEGQNIAIEYRYAEGSPIGSLSLRPSWCVSRLISSW